MPSVLSTTDSLDVPGTASAVWLFIALITVGNCLNPATNVEIALVTFAIAPGSVVTRNVFIASALMVARIPTVTYRTVFNPPTLSITFASTLSTFNSPVPSSMTCFTKSESMKFMDSSSNVALNSAILPLMLSRYFSFSFSAEPAEFAAVLTTSSATLKFSSIEETTLALRLPPICSRIFACVISVSSPQTSANSFII